MFQEKNHQEDDNGNEPYSFQDEVTEKKIKRHINDITDVISETDIKNVKIPGSEKPSNHIKNRNGEKKPRIGSSEGNPVSPWDIVD